MENNEKTDKKLIASKDESTHQIKHKKLQKQMSYGAMIILVVVVVSFVAWPILSNNVSASQNIHFGNYKGEPIQYTENYGLFNNNLNSLLNQFGIDSTSSDYQRRIVFERAFFSTVNQYGHYFFLRDRGNDVSNQEANALIYKQFVQNGKFNRAAWNQLQDEPNRLKNVQNIMHYAAAQNIWNDIYESAELINNKELELLVPTLGDVRKVSYLYYKVANFPETEVEKFYNENSNLFQKQFMRRIVVDSKDNLEKVEEELKNNGNFGELAQIYSNDVYSQSKGEYGYKFYYEIRDFFSRDSIGDVTGDLASEWSDKIFALQQGQYAGPYKLADQWYFFQIKTAEEIKAEEDVKDKIEDATPGENQTENELSDSIKPTQTEESTQQETAFTAVASTVRSYIEDNEISLITNYFRKNLEILKSRAESADNLEFLDQEGLGVQASFSTTPEFFGFNYSSEGSTPLYESMTKSFTEDSLAAVIAKSKQFFEDIFSLKIGEFSKVMLFGVDEQNQADQQYIAFFRLDEFRDSNVRDFARSKTDGLDSKKSLYNYYFSSLLTGGQELKFLNKRNLSQNFENAYNSWSNAQAP